MSAARYHLSDRPDEAGSDVPILIQLKILGMLKPNERISTTGVLLRIDPTSKMQWLRRWWCGEARSQNIVAIGRVVQSAIEMINDGAHWLYDDLLLCAKGLRNLLITYESDSLTKAQVLVLLQKISDLPAPLVLEDAKKYV